MNTCTELRKGRETRKGEGDRVNRAKRRGGEEKKKILRKDGFRIRKGMRRKGREEKLMNGLKRKGMKWKRKEEKPVSRLK